MLAGLELGFLVALQGDCGVRGPLFLPKRRSWTPETLRYGQWLLARQLTLKAVEKRKLPLVLRRTHGFLECLPAPFVADLVTWAPPVVAAPKQPGGFAPILGNIIPAFVASCLIPEHRVEVVVTQRAARPPVSLLDLAAWPITPLLTLCTRHRDRLVTAAPDNQVAQTLTGLQHAMVSRIRHRAEALAHG